MAGVTPNASQLAHADRHVESTLSGYPDKDRLQRAMSGDQWKPRLLTLVDELGFDPTNILELFRFEVYEKFLDFDCPNLTQLAVPAVRDGFNWILPTVAIHDSMPNEAIFRQLQKRFAAKHESAGAWKYTVSVLDEVITVNDRDPLKTGPYAVRVRDRQEADEELKSISANQLTQRRIPGITLYERMVLEGFYYTQTGQQLDVTNLTLCSGSRLTDGSVPDVYWLADDRKLYVSRVDPDDVDDRWRCREVVS